MILKDKVAVIYGAGGAVGGAVARAFATEGAELFLTGRRRAPVEAVAKDIVAAGGSAEAAEVDALEEQAVDKHLQSVIDRADRVDISFDAVGIPGTKLLGVPLAELDVDQFSRPITTYTTSYFLTARLAARHMIPKRSGVIMTVTSRGRASRRREASVRRWPPRRRSLESYPRSSRLTAFAWSV
jgi:NAD(P)-dependent dehydrogenase (short-subunit alcohol dehydrogenase family)